MDNFKKRWRGIIFICLIIIVMVIVAVRLMYFQIVKGEALNLQSTRLGMGEQIIEAPRGEIVDINGKPLVMNQMCFNVVFEYAFFPKDNAAQNEIILNVVRFLKANGQKWEDSLPISTTYPYEYTDKNKDTVATVTQKLRLNSYATAEDCIKKLIELNEIPDQYSPEEQRTIAGIRYEMIKTTFSKNNRFTLSKNIPQMLAIQLKETSFMYPGVDVVQMAERVYPDGTIFPHGIGTVGAITSEEWQDLDHSVYLMSDKIGKAGIEYTMEKYLRGINGKRQIAVNSANQIVSINQTEPVVPGNKVVLTIDSEFQKVCQKALEEQINYTRTTQKSVDKGQNAYAGSLVVMDVKTGAVKAMVNYPSYDINDYLKDYAAIANAEHAPLTNRALQGSYRPGSTFKPINATASLNEGIITPTSTVNCTGTYTFYSDYQPKCFVNSPTYRLHSGPITVERAIQDSCNIFFYDTARRLGIEKLNEYSKQFGYGTDLGFDLPAKQGYVPTPEVFEQFGVTWDQGQVLQAGIGQSETSVNTLNLAVEAVTLANNGVRMKPYIIDSVWSYDGSEQIMKTEPEVKYTVEDKTGYTFATIKEGMKKVATPLNLRYSYDRTSDLKYTVAAKTGSPQNGAITDAALIAYYPADDPQIAIGVMIEDGWNAKLLLKPIIKAYFGE